MEWHHLVSGGCHGHVEAESSSAQKHSQGGEGGQAEEDDREAAEEDAHRLGQAGGGGGEAQPQIALEVMRRSVMLDVICRTRIRHAISAAVAAALGCAVVSCEQPTAPGPNTPLGLRVWASVSPLTLSISNDAA